MPEKPMDTSQRQPDPPSDSESSGSPAGGDNEGLEVSHLHDRKYRDEPQSPLPPPRIVYERSLWVLLWVIGAIVLIILIAVAVTQMPSLPRKGIATTEVTVSTALTASGAIGREPPAARG